MFQNGRQRQRRMPEHGYTIYIEKGMEKGERIKGERRGRKGGGRRESGRPFSTFKLAPKRLDTLLINRYNM